MNEPIKAMSPRYQYASSRVLGVYSALKSRKSSNDVGSESTVILTDKKIFWVTKYTLAYVNITGQLTSLWGRRRERGARSSKNRKLLCGGQC